MRVKRIQQQDVEETAAINLRQSVQQAQRRGVLSLVRANPLERQDGLDRAADHLAAHQAMVILDLLDGLPLFVQRNDPSLQTELTTATETAEYLDAVQCSHHASLHAAGVQGFIPFQSAIDVHQHLFQRF